MKKYELAVLAMHTLDGGDIALDIEDIAMKCEQISPGTFAWRKYKDQINLELVGFAVRDAKKEKYGAYVTGTHAKGWRLTPAGVKLGKELLSASESLKNVQVSPSRDHSIQTKRANAEINRILDSQAFLDWRATKEPSKKSISQLLKINTYSSEELVSIKLSRLEKLRGLDAEIDDFLDFLESKKGEIL